MYNSEEISLILNFLIANTDMPSKQVYNKEGLNNYKYSFSNQNTQHVDCAY